MCRTVEGDPPPDSVDLGSADGAASYKSNFSLANLEFADTLSVRIPRNHFTAGDRAEGPPDRCVPTPGNDDRCRRVEALVEILLVS
jgi:hypothetical protein